MRIILGTVICMTLGALWLYAPPMSVERRAWGWVRPQSYSFEFRYTCFCPGSGVWWRISVRDESGLYYQLVDPSKLTRHFDGLESPPVVLPNLSTIFDDIANRASGSTYYRVRYDPRWHFPVYAHGENLFRTDSDWTFSVRDFHPDPGR
jgi:uncharacterized protein DUF6174